MPRTRLRLRVSLVGSEPEIWRTLDLDAALSLHDLHAALQVVLGWRESHLHKFTDIDPSALRRRRPLAEPPGGEWGDEFTSDEDDIEPEDETTIGEAFAQGGPLWYEYDFGDGWIHVIELIERERMDAHEPPVTLIRGENRAPYEDSGGIGGYAEKLAIVADPAHPEHRDIAEWVHAIAGPWAPADPTFFDPDGVQSELNLLFNPAASGIDPSDMSGLVAAEAHRSADALTLASPLVELAGALPAPIRSELRQHLHRTGALSPIEIDTDTATATVAPFIWLLDTIGTDGLALTSAGWMPPATVLEGMTALGWTETWIGKANREDITIPMRILRETAQRMGIVRVQKGRLLLGADAKKALGDPIAIWRLVASRVTRKFTDAETDAAVLYLLSLADGTPKGERYDAIAFGLDMLGWRPRSGWRLSDRDIDAVTERTRDVFYALGLSGRRHTPSAEEERAITLFARQALR